MVLQCIPQIIIESSLYYTERTLAALAGLAFVAGDSVVTNLASAKPYATNMQASRHVENNHMELKSLNRKF